jgi:hypothetical protein
MRWWIVRHLSACIIGLGLLSSSADAAVIWLYKEIETVSASVTVTGPDGVTRTDSHQSSGAVWSDPLVSQIAVNADPDTLSLPSAYYEGMIGLGSSAAVEESGASLSFSSATGYGECNDLACTTGATRADVDMTFRPGDQAAFRASYYPTGGTVDAVLADLTTGTIIHQAHATSLTWPSNGFTFEFPNNHLYRYVAAGVSLSPPAGDPYADFGIRFYDRVTSDDADIAPVPEPMSIVLVGTGLAGMIARRRRTARNV